jgi:hypothetical protein
VDQIPKRRLDDAGQQMLLGVTDNVISNVFYNVGPEFYGVYRYTPVYEDRIPNKLFNCFMNRICPTRQSWLYQFQRKNIIDQGIITFNLFYLGELDQWVNTNFSISREGDVTNHTKHLANGIFALENCTQEYVDAMQPSNDKNLIPKNWKENPVRISSMIKEITKFDNFRNESFLKTFPEVAKFYSRYL